MVYVIREVLCDLGIPKILIYANMSGSKGYHVEIFFEKEIHITQSEQLFNIVKNKIGELIDVFPEGEIERRPLPNQGMKLPLGIHRKTGNICWFVDIDDGCAPIKTQEYILTVDKVNNDIIETILEDHSYQKKPKSITKVKKKTISIPTRDLDTPTVEKAETLLRYGIQSPGTRHKSLVQLSYYYRHLGFHQEEIEDALTKWLIAQPKNMYKTPYKECQKEIKRMAISAMQKDFSFLEQSKTISFYSSEVEALFGSQNTPKPLSTYMALLIHHKRFSRKDGWFFMSYQQVSTATGHSPRTAFTHIKKLQENGSLEYYQNYDYYHDGVRPMHKPNLYKIWLPDFVKTDDKKLDFTLMDLSDYRKIKANLVRHYYFDLVGI
nr:hypothetical protein [Evansella halocellulosilytica]